MILGHGNDRYNYDARGEIVDFSSNIAFNNHSKRIVEYLKGRLCDIENYPDPMALDLSRRVAKHHSVEVERVIVCNGSAEAFYMVAQMVSRRKPKCRSMIFTPSFAEYEDSCRLYNHDIEFDRLTNFAEIDYSTIDSVWIGTPNNPDGYRVSIEVIEEVASRNPNSIFVVDRAYNTLSASCDCDSGALSPNIILIHSLTKSFGIPGLRLGYIVAQREEIEQLRELRPPWSVNVLALAAGEYIMDHYIDMEVNREELLVESQYLQRELARIDGLEVTSSDSNLFLCRIVDGRRACDLHKYLVNKHNILVRDCSNFRGLTESHLRIAAQSRPQNDLLIKALRQWI